MKHGIESTLGFAVNDVGRNEEVGTEVLFDQAIHCVDHLGKSFLDGW